MNALKYVSLLSIFLVAAAGCARTRTNVTGTITRDGKPLEWSTENGFLLVIFVPENRRSDGEVYRAEAQMDGTFKLNEIRSGRYKVAIQQFDEKFNDALNHKYDPAKSPLRYEVTDDGQVIDIDLPKELP
jgi:hypothetical protein